MTVQMGQSAGRHPPDPAAVPAGGRPGVAGAGPDGPVDAALAPVRAALLSAAQAAAAAAIAAAADEAARTVAAAEAEAAELVTRARAEGAAEAAAMLAADRARGRREARRIALAARSEAYGQLRDRARSAVTAVRTEPVYGPIRDRLAARARQLVGSDAVVTEHPDGGVLGTGADRRCDLSLPALADRALVALGPEVERLWTP